MGIALIQDGDRSVLRLEGEIDIAVAAELKASLLEALESGREICVSLEGASALDVTAFQLLWAAQRESRRAGLALAFALTGSESIQHSLECMGLGGLLVAQDESAIGQPAVAFEIRR